ncbi:hypothetical protein PFISCL1PPCAC_1150, partial [Pristionchus fissidentatus]
EKITEQLGPIESELRRLPAKEHLKRVRTTIESIRDSKQQAGAANQELFLQPRVEKERSDVLSLSTNGNEREVKATAVVQQAPSRVEDSSPLKFDEKKIVIGHQQPEARNDEHEMIDIRRIISAVPVFMEIAVLNQFKQFNGLYATSDCRALLFGYLHHLTSNMMKRNEHQCILTTDAEDEKEAIRQIAEAVFQRLMYVTQGAHAENFGQFEVQYDELTAVESQLMYEGISVDSVRRIAAKLHHILLTDEYTITKEKNDEETIESLYTYEKMYPFFSYSNYGANEGTMSERNGKKFRKHSRSTINSSKRRRGGKI